MVSTHLVATIPLPRRAARQGRMVSTHLVATIPLPRRAARQGRMVSTHLVATIPLPRRGARQGGVVTAHQFEGAPHQPFRVHRMQIRRHRLAVADAVQGQGAARQHVHHATQAQGFIDLGDNSTAHLPALEARRDQARLRGLGRGGQHQQRLQLDALGLQQFPLAEQALVPRPHSGRIDINTPPAQLAQSARQRGPIAGGAQGHAEGIGEARQLFPRAEAAVQGDQTHGPSAGALHIAAGEFGDAAGLAHTGAAEQRRHRIGAGVAGDAQALAQGAPREAPGGLELAYRRQHIQQLVGQGTRQAEA